MGYGDEILAAGQAEVLYRADPSRRVAIYDLGGNVRDHEMWRGNPAIASRAEVASGEPVQRLVSAPNARPYIKYPFTAASGWTFRTDWRARDHVARVYLTDAEAARGQAARETWGPYVLIEPYTVHGNFEWPLERWAGLVAAMPDLTFVQHTHGASRGVVGAHQTGATFREACGLALWSSAYVRSESGLSHAASALGVPTVVLWGGTMNADVLGGYAKRVDVVDRGPGSPCGSWEYCPHCRAIMRALPVEDVAAALRVALREERAIA